jgi:hypothetical protein
MNRPLFALICVCAVSAALAGEWYTQQVFFATGTGDAPLVGYSQSGASAGMFDQDTHFNSPAVTIARSGTAGGEIATSPTVLVQSSLETTSTTPVMQVGGCLALSGDNWLITWGDGALSLPGGFLDNTGKVHGHISVDPVHRQLVAEDGVTPVLTWTGSTVQLSSITLNPGTAPGSPAAGQIYFDSGSHHFMGWNGSAWKQLDN